MTEKSMYCEQPQINGEQLEETLTKTHKALKHFSIPKECKVAYLNRQIHFDLKTLEVAICENYNLSEPKHIRTICVQLIPELIYWREHNQNIIAKTSSETIIIKPNDWLTVQNNKLEIISANFGQRFCPFRIYNQSVFSKYVSRTFQNETQPKRNVNIHKCVFGNYKSSKNIILKNERKINRKISNENLRKINLRESR